MKIVPCADFDDVDSSFSDPAPLPPLTFGSSSAYLFQAIMTSAFCFTIPSFSLLHIHRIFHCPATVEAFLFTIQCPICTNYSKIAVSPCFFLFLLLSFN
jgi:hypothetical protein